jgi:D-ribose pyranase
MKKSGILHSELSRIVAGMGHGDKLVICDSGLPIPHGRPVAEVVLTLNIPRFIDTLKVVLEELHIEEAIVAQEMERVNNRTYRELQKILDGIPIKKVPHQKFKHLIRTEPNVSFVRTGEATKYSNVILVSGVVF